MPRPEKVLSPEQVKQRLRMQGETITQWAAKHGYTRNEVYRVLNGQAKAHYGKAHDIAVALGLKPSTEQAQRAYSSKKATTGPASCNPQKDAA